MQKLIAKIKKFFKHFWYKFFEDRLIVEGTLLKFNEPTKNGRIYKYEDFKSKSQVPVTINLPLFAGTFDVKDVGAFALLKKNKDKVEYRMITLKNPNGRQIKMLFNSGFKVVPAGYGNVDSKGNISNYQLTSAFLTNRPAI